MGTASAVKQARARVNKCGHVCLCLYLFARVCGARREADALSTRTLKPSSSHGRSGRLREAKALGADADPSAEELHGWHEAADAAGSPEAELLADIALVSFFASPSLNKER